MTTPDLVERFTVTLDGQDFQFVPTMKFVFAMGEIESTMAGDPAELTAENGERMMENLKDAVRSATRRNHDFDEVMECVGEMTFTEVIGAVRQGLSARAENAENFPTSPPES